MILKKPKGTELTCVVLFVEKESAVLRITYSNNDTSLVGDLVETVGVLKDLKRDDEVVFDEHGEMRSHIAAAPVKTTTTRKASVEKKSRPGCMSLPEVNY